MSWKRYKIQTHGYYGSLIGSPRSIRVSSNKVEWPWNAGRDSTRGSHFPRRMRRYARIVWARANERSKLAW